MLYDLTTLSFSWISPPPAHVIISYNEFNAEPNRRDTLLAIDVTYIPEEAAAV